MKTEIREIQEAFATRGYVAEPEIATAVYLARDMRRPLLIEGDAGVGKTEVAKVLAATLDAELIRLQCYEGIDAAAALYEWNYPRQFLRLKIAEGSDGDRSALEETIFGPEFLLERPLLRALRHPGPAPVLLIDEIDRADDGFEAFLLEALSDFQITIPELGTITASDRPHVILTSNHTREIGDALRRRCLYLYIEHPTFEKEVEILRRRVPDISTPLAAEIARFVQSLRHLELAKPPGVAETLDWTNALERFDLISLDADVVRQTLGCLVKDRADLAAVSAELDTLVSDARSQAA